MSLLPIRLQRQLHITNYMIANSKIRLFFIFILGIFLGYLFLKHLFKGRAGIPCFLMQDFSYSNKLRFEN